MPRIINQVAVFGLGKVGELVADLLGESDFKVIGYDAAPRDDHAFEVKPLDSDRTWIVGRDDSEYPVPVIAGPAADLGWWLTGRPAPDTVSCSHGELPQIGAWCP